MTKHHKKLLKLGIPKNMKITWLDQMQDQNDSHQLKI